ncbi:MAG: hypothetical protein RIB67_00815 [Miltoncostaeaceae bacterium]
MSQQSVDDILALLDPLRAAEPPSGPIAAVPAASYHHMSHEGLRQRHAHETADRPDAAVSFECAGAHLHLWAKAGPGGRPWAALATSVSRPDRMLLNAGYRVLADDADQAAEFGARPELALAHLVTRHGISYYSGTRRVFLLPEHIIEISQPLDRLGPAEFQKAVALAEPPDGAQVAVNVALSNTPQGATRLSWFFVLDMTAYSREVTAARR